MDKREIVSDLGILAYQLKTEDRHDKERTKLHIDAIEGAIALLNAKISDNPTKIEDSYPQNLLMQMGIVMSDAEARESEDKVEEALATLTERERTVIRCRFKDMMTLEETGRLFSVNKERIREIEAKALRKLRHPVRRDLVIMGADAMECIKRRREALKAGMEELETEIRKVRLQIKEIRATGKLPEGYDAVTYDMETGIEEMKLSVRSYNCLRRHGFRKVKDLEGITVKQLMNIRNLGKKSMDEIIEKLALYGIEVASR